MAESVTTAEFRHDLSKHLETVRNGGTIVITRNGFPVAQLVPFANPVLAVPAVPEPLRSHNLDEARDLARQRQEARDKLLSSMSTKRKGRS